MKKFFILFAATCIASAAWAQVTAEADPGEITFNGKSAPTSYHFSSVAKIKAFLDEKELPRLSQTEADRLAEHLFEPLEIVSGFNRDVIAEDTVKLDRLKNDGTPAGGQQLVTIAGKKRNGDHLVQSYYVQDADIANIKSAENPDGTNTFFKTQYISYSYASQNVITAIQGTNNKDNRFNCRAGFPEPNAEGVRRVECIADGPNDAYVGLHWHLAPYEELNALCLRKGIAGSNDGTERTGFFEFKNVGCYQELYFLVAATGSSGDTRILYTTVTYSDGTTDHRSFTFDDHANILKKISGKVGSEDKTVYDTTAYREKAACHDNFGTYSVSENSGVICLRDSADGKGTQKSYKIWHSQFTSYAIVCEMEVETHKLIDRIDFTTQDPENKKNTSDGISLVIFAVTGKVANIAAPDANPAPHSRAPMRTSNITSESFDVEWDEVSGAASYRLDVATDEDFHHMVGGYNNMTVNGTSAHVDGLDDENEHEYYWRVRSVDASGGQSASSAPRKTVLVGGTAPSTHETGDAIEADLQNLINVAVPSITITRTLYKDGDFNTLCLPFDLSAEALAASPIAGCELYEFVGAKVLGSSQLDIEMRRTNDLVAGVPYLLKWPNTNEVISELVFHNVTITKSKGDTIIGVNDEERTALVRFIGNLDQQYLGNGNKNYLFLGANNTLYWPNTDNNMYGFRAYFDIPSLRSTPAASPVRQGMPARIVLQEQVATGVENTSAKFGGSEKHLENGELVIIRDGIRYNVMGLQLR